MSTSSSSDSSQASGPVAGSPAGEPRNGRPSLVIFADARSPASVVLLHAALRAAARRDDLTVACVCDAGGTPPRPFTHAARLIAEALAKRLFDPAQKVVLRRSMLRSMAGAARRAGVPVLVPPEHDVNHPDFVAHLREELRPSFGLSLLVVKVFRPPLLAAFERIVNFHPGRLPDYRGLMPTGWELYRGEAEAGLAFHVMTEGLDEGPVLVEDTVAVTEGVTASQLGWAKIWRATALFGPVLDALVAGAPGLEQGSSGGYFGGREAGGIQHVEDAAALTWEELGRRLRAFGKLRMRLGGETQRVTRLRRLDGRRPRRASLSFTTLDGVVAEASRIRYLPVWLERLSRRRPRARRR